MPFGFASLDPQLLREARPIDNPIDVCHRTAVVCDSSGNGKSSRFWRMRCHLRLLEERRHHLVESVVVARRKGLRGNGEEKAMMYKLCMHGTLL